MVAKGVLTGTKPLPDVPDWMGGGDPGNDAAVLTSDSSQPGGAKLANPYGLSIFGDGSDGPQTFDGTTTILGMAPSSSVYTLTRDVFLSGGTVNNGVTIVTNSYRLFCSGTLIINGTIHWNGKVTGGSSLVNGNGSISFNNVGGAPGSGTTATGTNGSGVTESYGGAGGHGAAGTSAGGSGGTATAPSLSKFRIRWLGGAVLASDAGGGATFATLTGGGGGGGGGGDGTNSGADAGSGGGIVVLVARAIAGAGAIQARGANGVNATVGNTGGGGGGGGGLVIVVSGSVSGGAVAGQTIDANGGSVGASHGTGGAGGSAGSNGTVIFLAA